MKDLKHLIGIITVSKDRNERRNIERWVENLVILDIIKIILASDKRTIPQSYKETLKIFAGLYMNFKEGLAERFATFAEPRNIIAYEYLDIKWEKIKKFTEEAEKFYPQFIKNYAKSFTQKPKIVKTDR